MNSKPNLQPLINHLCHSSDLNAAQARKVVDEVIAYFAETPDAYVRRRHRELKHETGLNNSQIFVQIEVEMTQLVFTTPALTQRQIRRIIYG